MIYALAAIVIVLASSAAAFAAVNGDFGLTSSASSEKQAYAAAQAGIQRYLAALNQDPNFWTQCVPTSVAPGQQWINQLNASPVSAQAVGVAGSSTERYAVTLLPANGAAECDATAPQRTMIVTGGTDAGAIRISSTGYAGPSDPTDGLPRIRRTLVATLQQQSFLNYAYYTNYETPDPWVQVAIAYDDSVVAGMPDQSIEAPGECSTGCGTNYQKAVNKATAQCDQPAAARNSAPFYGSYDCSRRTFVSGSINGPLYSNDQLSICGHPTFGRPNTPSDQAVFGITPSTLSPTYSETAKCNDGADFVDGYQITNHPLTLPPGNSQLAQEASPGYLLQGTTCLELNGSQIEYAQPGRGANLNVPSCFSSGLTYLPINGTGAYPDSHVLYVDNAGGSCPVTYDIDDPQYVGNNECGTVYVFGHITGPLTIGAANDIVITNNLTYDTSGAVLGLVADRYVRIYHPIGNQPLGTNNSSCSAASTNANGTISGGITIQAMIMSLTRSFVADQFNCGNGKLGAIRLLGGIAEEFRGPVGDGAPSNTGYTIDYTYDDRLRYLQPPHFINPVSGSWQIQRQTECDASDCAASP